MDVAHYAFVQVRLQARHGARPDAATWAQLESIQDPARFLDVARTTALQPWVTPLTADTDVHTVEQFWRKHLREYIDAIAAWHPQAWAPAFQWTKRLLDLPAIQHLATSDWVPPWMQEDEALQECAFPRAEDRLRALASLDCSSLVQAARSGISLLDAWRDQWRRLWPAAPRAQLAAIEHLSRELDILALPPPGEHISIFPVVLEHLEARFRHAFRRDFFQPAAGFIHIALVTLDLLRLRAMLLPRIIFRARGEPQ